MLLIVLLVGCLQNDSNETSSNSTGNHEKCGLFTQEMAEYIAEQINADIMEIKPVNPYPDDYNETGDIAKVKCDENQRPAIANLPDLLDGYDTIFIGYPIWWHTAPMIIGTFLENYDLSNFEIYSFIQSASIDTEQLENSMFFV